VLIVLLGALYIQDQGKLNIANQVAPPSGATSLVSTHRVGP
jgi:hypothetical protein